MENFTLPPKQVIYAYVASALFGIGVGYLFRGLAHADDCCKSALSSHDASVSHATGNRGMDNHGGGESDKEESEDNDDDAYLFSDGPYPIFDNYEVSSRSKFKMVHFFELGLRFI
jgi:hypothetical protein